MDRSRRTRLTKKEKEKSSAAERNSRTIFDTPPCRTISRQNQQKLMQRTRERERKGEVTVPCGSRCDIAIFSPSASIFLFDTFPRLFWQKKNGGRIGEDRGKYLQEGTEPSSGGREFIASRRVEIEKREKGAKPEGADERQAIADNVGVAVGGGRDEVTGVWRGSASLIILSYYLSFFINTGLARSFVRSWSSVVAKPRRVAGDEVIYGGFKLVSSTPTFFFCVLIQIRSFVHSKVVGNMCRLRQRRVNRYNHFRPVVYFDDGCFPLSDTSQYRHNSTFVPYSVSNRDKMMCVLTYVTKWKGLDVSLLFLVL